MSPTSQIPAEQLLRLKACKIMIADDSRAIRAFLRHQLTELGLGDEVQEAEDGNDALRKMLEQPADILFCDLAMPGMDGVELLRELARTCDRLAVVPISSMEARLRIGVSQMAHELGMEVLGILGKPFDLEELVETLNRYGNSAADMADEDLSFSEDDLSDAMKSKRVEMHFQPQVRMADKEVLGFEALVRMMDRTGNLVSPARFIEMSESTGQIHRLSHLIIESSISQLGIWNKMGYKLNLSINFSAATLSKLDLPEHVDSIARNRGVSPNQLTIELTESQLDTGAELYDVMTRFRMKGFGLSIDDFGTGDSSLSRLRRMPFTELKIDQEFVKGCTRDPDLRSIVNNSIQLGHELGMIVVAEGIQSHDEWDLLEQAGCDIGQGFLLSKPLVARDAVAWMHQWKRLHPH